MDYCMHTTVACNTVVGCLPNLVYILSTTTLRARSRILSVHRDRDRQASLKNKFHFSHRFFFFPPSFHGGRYEIGKSYDFRPLPGKNAYRGSSSAKSRMS